MSILILNMHGPVCKTHFFDGIILLSCNFTVKLNQYLKCVLKFWMRAHFCKEKLVCGFYCKKENYCAQNRKSNFKVCKVGE